MGQPGSAGASVTSGGSIKAVVVANEGSDTFYGSDSNSAGVGVLSSSPGVTLDASNTYVLQCTVNLVEDDGGSAGTMDGEFKYSVDLTGNGNWTKFADVKQFEHKTGGSGHGYQYPHDVTFIKGFTTNASGGSYYFLFDTGHNDAGSWNVHDFNIKIMENVTLVGGATHTQS